MTKRIIRRPDLQPQAQQHNSIKNLTQSPRRWHEYNDDEKDMIIRHILVRLSLADMR